MRSFVTDSSMSSASACCLRMLPPGRVPALQTMRAQLGEALRSGVADYASRAATLSHRESAAALRALCDQLPLPQSRVAVAAHSATAPLLNPSLADDAAHDRYFRICRVEESQPVSFVRMIVTAASLFHCEIASAY